MSRQQRPFGLCVHTLNYFLMSCPISRSFSFLSFGNKFSLKITKHAVEEKFTRFFFKQIVCKKLTANCSDGRFPACHACLAVALSKRLLHTLRKD